MISHISIPEPAIQNLLSFRSIGTGARMQVSNKPDLATVLYLNLPGYSDYKLPQANNCKEVVEVNSIEKAREFLLQKLQVKQEIPKLIVYQGRIRFMQLRQFYEFLQSHESLRYIPFVFNNGDEGVFDKDELYEMVRNRLFDNVVSATDCFKSLLTSADMMSNLKRVRMEHKEQNYSCSKEEVNNKSIDLILKRAVDILVSSVALIVLSPLLLLIAIVLWLESRGPILYISKRAGKGFDVFDFYKFRTMVVDADKKLEEYQQLNKYTNDEEESKSPLFFKLKNDPRVTRVGAFLRKTSLDELPQLFNVLKGDMSLVGNRPLPLYEATTLTNDACAERFEAPAGITGLWQISKKGQESMSVEERVNLDIEYSKKFSFLFDLKILALTPKAMLQE